MLLKMVLQAGHTMQDGGFERPRGRGRIAT